MNLCEAVGVMLKVVHVVGVMAKVVYSCVRLYNLV